MSEARADGQVQPVVRKPLVNPDGCVAIRVPKVMTDPLLLVQGPQFRFPRSKRKRVRKKWSRRIKNFRRVPDPNFYEVEKGCFVCHPTLHGWLARQLKEMGYTYYGYNSTVF